MSFSTCSRRFDGDIAERLFVLLTLAAALTAVVVAFTLPLSDNFDERAHYAYVRAMAAAPALFPDHDLLRLLDASGMAWSAEPNYLAHPPLYYLLVAPLSALSPGHPLPVRLADALLAGIGFVLAGLGGLPRLSDRRARLLFVAVLFGLPAMVGVAGLVNNDDLMIAEMGGLIFLLGRRIAAPVAVALLLAALGWTKLTGFVAGASLVAIAVATDREAPLRRHLGLLAAGILVGGLPLLHDLATLGRPVWVPAAFPAWFGSVPSEIRDTVDIVDFLGLYVELVGRRLPYRADTFAAAPVLVMIYLAAAMASLPRAIDRHGRRGPVVALAVVALFVAMHFAYAWIGFRTHGSLADLQPRYLGAVWPLLAFAVATGVAALPRRASITTAACLCLGLGAVSSIGVALLTAIGAG